MCERARLRSPSSLSSCRSKPGSSDSSSAAHQLPANLQIGINPTGNVFESLGHHSAFFPQTLIDRRRVLEPLDNHVKHRLFATDYTGSVETVASPAPCSNACSTARQGSIAHFTRCGKFRTPFITQRSPRVLGAFICVIGHQIVERAEHSQRFRATFPLQFHRHQRR